MYHDYSMEKIMKEFGTPSPKNFILDTDTANEIDDQFAVTYAMLAEEINLLAITAAPFVGRCAPTPAEGAELSYQEMIRVRDMVDPEGKMNIPCYRGSASYLESMDKPVMSEAAENIVRIVNETPGTVYVAAIGCFTNVASALLIDPSIKDKAVVLMIGANCFENTNGDCNEYNLAQDRKAARVIFECGVPLAVLPAIGGTENLYTTNAELNFYLKDQAGRIGNYLCGLFERDEGGLFLEDGTCNCRSRIIWDIGSVAVLRLGKKAARIRMVPARTIDPDGFWCKTKDLGHRMIMADCFNRSAVLSDFYSLLKRSDLK